MLADIYIFIYLPFILLIFKTYETNKIPFEKHDYRLAFNFFLL